MFIKDTAMNMAIMITTRYNVSCIIGEAVVAKPSIVSMSGVYGVVVVVVGVP